mgnify:CR=1 FL=1
MGQYKVPQNVEAEDKILGPLTFKQFIYAFSGVGWALICFALFKTVPVLLILVAGPPTTLLLLLAFYTRDGQNFEQLLIALVGFFANSRRRVWRKDTIIDSFHVIPHQVAAARTQRDPAKVRSELEKLATLIDSRGWDLQPDAPQNAPASGMPGPSSALPTITHEERLVAPVAVSQQQQNALLEQPKASEDILDLQNSPLAQNLSSLIEEAANDLRQEAITQMNQPAPVPGAAPAMPLPGTSAAVAPAIGAPPVALPVTTGPLAAVPAGGVAGAAMPTASLAAAPVMPVAPASVSGVTSVPTGDILKLATERDDLTVSQLAASAERLVPLVPGQAVDVRTNAQATTPTTPA